MNHSRSDTLPPDKHHSSDAVYWRGGGTTSCTGSTFPSGCSTSCVQRFTAVCSTRHHITWKIAPSLRTTDTARHQHLRSAGCHQLLVPRHRRFIFGRRAFSVAGPVAWNSLPDYLRDPTRSVDSFRRDLKIFIFSLY